jgi:unsaturated rhamnogalacturonyl hydrolase
MDRRTFLATTAAAGSVPLLASVSSASAATSVAARATSNTDLLPSRKAILATMAKVDDYWIARHPTPGANDWARATYFSGVMAHFRASRNPKYLDYALSWAAANNYALIGGNTTRYADNLAAGHVYLDLYKTVGGAEKIADIKTCLSNIVNGPADAVSDWTWSDALHMAMPAMASLGSILGDSSYANKMYNMYHFTKRQLPSIPAGFAGAGLMSESANLWYRDGNYSLGGKAAVSPNGKAVLWSRANGWVISAHAKVLQSVSPNGIRGPEYVTTIRNMAAALAAVQRSDGFWNVNLADPKHNPGLETSGTAFHVFGIAHGIRLGILPTKTYIPVVARAWNGLVKSAISQLGLLGYNQGVGASPTGYQPNRLAQADYGLGAFLLAGAELQALSH